MDTQKIREAFPALKREFAGRPVVYFDSAATYLKPQPVIDAVADCYRSTAGTIGRGVHVMAEDASVRFREAREAIADFINADSDEIVFVRNATEAINLVAASLTPGSRVAGSLSEHHSNLLPWRQRHQFHAIPMFPNGQVRLEEAGQLLTGCQPHLLACSTIGNAFGNVQPIDQLVDMAHSVNTDVLLDVNQSIAHRSLDVRELDCEYACFSGHKLGGPTGVGVLYAKRDRLEKLQPQLFGGGMVDSVDEAEHQLADLPMRLEAGTPAFEAVIGLAAACEFFEDIGLEAIHQHESQLTAQLREALGHISRIELRGPKDNAHCGAIVAFQIQGLEAHGAARMLSNRANLCLRSGFHCAEQAHHLEGGRPSLRVSFGMYNTQQEVDLLVDSLTQITANLN